MHRLDPMLMARSVAVVGASGRAGSVGEMTLRQLIKGGFSGTVYPINPRYQSISGLTCFPTLDHVDEEVDVAVLAVSNASLETEVERAVANGARSLVIFASCHGTAADGTSLRSRLTRLVDEAGVPVCGGNGMGLVNVESDLRLCGFYQPELSPGGISFITHSGSLFSAMLHNRRDLGFNLVVSAGLEMNTRMSDYVDWVLDRPSTRVVALFLETVRDPAGFTGTLARAVDRQIPVVALKVGASEKGREAVATHSEALAGEELVYDALFDLHGVHRVHSMDEMLDTVELLASVRRLFPGGLGAVHDSGGERALLIDTADRVGVPLADIGAATVKTLAGVLDPGLEPENPVDAWGTGHDAASVFVSCLDALAADPAVGVIAFSVDLTAEDEPGSEYGVSAVTSAANTDKPVLVLPHVTSAVDPTQARRIRRSGVPVLEGTETGLRAVRHLIDRAERASRPPPLPRMTVPGVILGHDPLDLLSSYRIPYVETMAARDQSEAMTAAAELGYPVVLKTATAAHKTEVDGIRLGLGGRHEVAEAYDDIAARLGPDVTVSRQIPSGVEVGLGAVIDSQFGPVVTIAAGGALIELLNDVVGVMPPIDVLQARRVIDRLSLSSLLTGIRGAEPVAIAALVDLVARFSELVADLAEVIDAIDLNPIIVGPQGAIAVDVLVKWVE